MGERVGLSDFHDVPEMPKPEIGPRGEPVLQHSWRPLDLLEFADAPPSPPSLCGLVYPGKRHVFSGEPETLKTWAADVLAVEEIRKGCSVLYIDFEMGAREIASRLRSLGVSDEEFSAFVYITPSEPLRGEAIEEHMRLLLGIVRPSLVVFDAFTGALEIHNFSPNDGIEVERFYRTVVSPFQAHNAAVVLLDHVTKDKTTRGKFSVGSERKLGGCDVHLGFELVRPFGRGRSGLAKIMTHKDRPGHLPRPKASELELISDSDTGAVSWLFREPEPVDFEHAFRPTALMQKVSRYVYALVEEELPATQNSIEAAISGKAAFVRQAIDILVAEGFLSEEEGPRHSRLLRPLRLYIEDSAADIED